MPVAILFPRYDDPAIERRYASWQSQLLLRRDGGEMHFYDFDERAGHAVSEIASDHVMVITDPLLLPAAHLGDGLLKVLAGSGAFAAVPTSTETTVPAQQFTPPAHVTLRELEAEMAAVRESGAAPERVTWGAADPGAYLVVTASLDEVKKPLREAIAGTEVVVSRTDVIHRWRPISGPSPDDFLSRISPTAKSILEIGDGSLGAALKQRQKCRVVAIETDQRAVAAARKLVDDVYCGEITEVVALIHENFDAVIGGDVVSHLAEPWTFIADLRRIVRPGGQLLLTIPNLANASIVADLLHGRFDYLHSGPISASRLRFFTRRTIEDMLTIAGWETVAVEPQGLTVTSESEALLARLEASHVPFSREDLLPAGFHVTARKPA